MNQNQLVEQNDVVEEAYNKISEIVQTKLAETMEKVGDYLLENFFENDYKKIWKNEHSKEGPFYQLVQKMRENHGQVPSKSWLYNAIKVAADKQYFQEKENKDYARLGISHKVKLTSVTNEENKKQLVEEIKEKDFQYTVNDLEGRIQSLKKPNKGKTNIAHIIEYPIEKFFNTPSKTLKKYQERAEKEIQKLTEEKKELESKLKKFEVGKKTFEDAIQSNDSQRKGK